MDIDLILRGRFLTMTDAGTVDAIAVHQGRILAVGPAVEGFTARTERDLGDTTVTPGFIDAHAHSVWFGLTLVELDVAPATTLDELYALVAERAAETPEGEWVIGAGFNQMYLDNQYPDPADLNRASGGRPVWLKHTSGHACVVDQRALEIIGADDHLEDGIEGGRIVVDADGRPTGLLEEQAMTLVQNVMLPYPLARIEEALTAASAHYVTEGLTSITDAGIAGGWIGHSPQEFNAYQNVADRGDLVTRHQVMPESSVLTEHGEAGRDGHFLGIDAGIRSGLGDERLQIGPAKFFLDGSILGATARLSEEYDHCAGSHGYFQGDPDEMRDRALAAARAGWSIAMHALGDEAVELAIGIAKTLRDEGVEPPLPLRIEHGGVVLPEQVERLAAVNLPIVGQPYFLSAYGDGMRRFLGDKRAEWSFRMKSMLEAGLTVALTSDRPVAQGAPLRIMQSAIERTTQSGHLYGGGERLTAHEALAAYTSGPAALTGWAGQKGVLAAGALADLTVLSADPTAVPTGEIGDIEVVATIVGGVAVHDPSGLIGS